MKNMNEGIEAFRAELEKQGAKNIGIYAQDWRWNSALLKSLDMLFISSIFSILAC